MIQSHVEQALSDAGARDAGDPASFWSRLVRGVERGLHISPGSFTPEDPDWYLVIARGVLERFADGNAPFNSAAAEYSELADDARLVVVGDWGTGLPRARIVAALMQAKIAEALAGGKYVADVAAQSRRTLVLFSHHQLVSVYHKPDVGSFLPDKLAPVLNSGRITAWWWGHEHRAITYRAASGVQFPRCLGNGGVPIRPTPDPPAGSSPGITWHSARIVRESGQNWTRFGFATLDLQPHRIEAAYIDDDGHVPYAETIT